MKQKKCRNCPKQFRAKTNKKYCCSNCVKQYWKKKNPEQSKLASRRWREKNPGYLGPKRQSIVDYITKLKETNPCQDCKNLYPACCMEFDHSKGKKTNEVGSMVAACMDLKDIKKEIKNCELVCSNCHRIRTKNRGSKAWKRSIK